MPHREIHTEIYELQRRIAAYEDESAYKELFAQLFLPLKKFAIGFLRSVETAEEIATDIFVEIWRRRSTLMEIKDLKVYMYVSVRNEALRKLQQLKKNATVSIDDFQYDFISRYNTPEEALLTSELLLRIRAAISNLPPRCKLVYKLAKEDKLKYKEISEILNISVKTVDNQLSAALRKIAAAINFRLKKDISI